MTREDLQAIALMVKEAIAQSVKAAVETMTVQSKEALAALQLELETSFKSQIDALPRPVDGRDGLDLEILPAIDETKNYPRGIYALHLGGLWRSYQATDGLKGWDCIVPGISEIKLSTDDPRDLVLTIATRTETKNFHIASPVMIYRDVYRAEGEYNKGDCCTYGGSLWHCNVDGTPDKPGTSKAWTLAAKHGRDGKDYSKGAK